MKTEIDANSDFDATPKRYTVDVLLNGMYRVHRRRTLENPNPGFVDLTEKQYRQFIELSRPVTIWQVPELTDQELDEIDQSINPGEPSKCDKTIKMIRYRR